MADSGQNRNQPATQRRLQKARESGDVPLSRELISAISLVLASVTLLFVTPILLSRSVAGLRAMLADSYQPDILWQAGFARSVAIIAAPVLPVVLAALIGGAGATLLQTRLLVRGAALRPDLKRLNPTQGLKRLFGIDGLIELGKSLVKLLLMLLGAWFALHDRLDWVADLPRSDGRLLPLVLRTPVVLIIAVALAVQIVSAVFDLLLARGRYLLRLRMSRQDLKDEYKETEGNPQAKIRIKRMQRTRLRAVAREVPKATVVVTNPTHYAVALAYDRATSQAPVIVAKGADFMAKRIREIARANDIPIIERPDLARALFRLEVDATIPPEHYKAVAEIIAFVWRLKGRPS